MKRKIFFRIFTLTFCSALLVFFAGLIAVSVSAKTLIRQRLEAETKLACALVWDSDDYKNFGIFFNNDEFRVTVLDLNGEVLYESDTKEGLENHANREEFKNALEGKSEAIERYSDTFKCKMTYYAQKTNLNSGEEIIIRLAVKNSQVSSYLSVALPLLFAVLVISAGVSFAFAGRQARSVTDKINRVYESLKSLNDGTYLPIVSDVDDKEIIAVYEEINELSVSLLTYITQEKTIHRQKSEFFANASHELKTPVTVMQGLSEILLSKDLDEHAKRQIDRIYKESLRLSSLISDMLKLSKLERGISEGEERVELSLSSIIKEAVGELSGAIAEKNLTVKIEGEAMLLGEYKHIYELIGNLLSNAVNYNKPDGEIEITVSSDGGRTCLTVRDTGIGIASEHIPRLCERFYRVDKSRSKKTGGTGLGLAIVKHVLAIYSAEMKIESELGVGTTVTVIFKSSESK